MELVRLRIVQLAIVLARIFQVGVVQVKVVLKLFFP